MPRQTTALVAAIGFLLAVGLLWGVENSSIDDRLSGMQKFVGGATVFSGFVGLPLALLHLMHGRTQHRNQQSIVAAVRHVVDSEQLGSLDPNRVFWHYTYEVDGPVEKLFQKWQYITDSQAAEKQIRTLEKEDLSQAASPEERWKLIAARETAGVRGLEHLQHDVRAAVHLHLIVEALRNSNAPGAFIRPLQEELRREMRFEWTKALFDAESLNASDLTPEEGGGRSYFSKYFQPLMLAFGERDFEGSSGTEEGDAQHALNDHLRSLAKGRAVAAVLSPANYMDVQGKIKQKLPRSSRRGALDSSSVRSFNVNEAAYAILVVTPAKLVEVARGIELTLKIEEKFTAASMHAAGWVPRLDKGKSEYCFLWQKTRNNH